MARTAREIMNPQLLSIHPAAPVKETLDLILEFGITAVPVLDSDNRPIGVSSLRDLLRVGVDEAPITKPATSVALHASVGSVAETMATTGRHHLVVVDADGRAVGMVSTLDVIRALIGYPVKHPATFFRRDPETGVSWSSEDLLDQETVTSTLPMRPGVIVLVRGGVDHDEDELVWAEATTDLHARASELCSVRGPCSANVNADRKLEQILEQGSLRMRYAVLDDPSARLALAARLRDRIEHAPPPGGT